VPPQELAELVARRSEVEPVTAALVAEEFDVPEPVAAEALLALARELGLGAGGQR
jgi:hypothetical protein